VWEFILFDDSTMVLVIDKIPNTGTNFFTNPVLGTIAVTPENSKSYWWI
jgi:hypothetical protein